MQLVTPLDDAGRQTAPVATAHRFTVRRAQHRRDCSDLKMSSALLPSANPFPMLLIGALNALRRRR